MRRVVDTNLGRMSLFDVVRALVLAALALWIGTYLGWFNW